MTDLKRLIQALLRCYLCNAHHVELVLLGAEERSPSLCGVCAQIKTREEQCITFNGILAQCACVKRDVFALACFLSNCFVSARGGEQND